MAHTTRFCKVVNTDDVRTVPRDDLFTAGVVIVNGVVFKNRYGHLGEEE